MKKRFKILIVISVLLFSINTVFAQKPKPIKFSKGTSAMTLTGRLNGYKDRKVFIVRVRQGQTLRTEQDKSELSVDYITVFIKSPSGKNVGESDASCNSRREITPTEAGDYRVTVVQCRKADPWRGTFNLKITVK